MALALRGTAPTSCHPTMSGQAPATTNRETWPDDTMPVVVFSLYHSVDLSDLVRMEGVSMRGGIEDWCVCVCGKGYVDGR